MTTKQILHLLHSALGQLDTGWQAVSGHDEAGSFCVIRYDSTLRPGAVKRMHSKIEDMLSEELGKGERVT